MTLNDNTEELRLLLQEVNSLPEASSGIDTSSDNPAESSDIAAGKEAFVNDKPVTGTVPVQEAGTDCDQIDPFISASWGDSEIEVRFEINKERLARTGSTGWTTVPSEELGYANPEDVVIGATFTSANGGLKKEGELERHGWFDVFREDMEIDDEGDFCIVKNLDKRYYIEENAGMYFDASLLGNAEPSDVAKGVFFTSENGILIEGIADVISSGETYTGDLYSYGTATANPASGVTSISFDNIPKEPDYFMLYLDSSDINQYHRVAVLMYDGSKLMGHELYSDTNVSNYYENTNDATDYRWRYSYSGTTLTISSQSADVGGYFHNPGTYTLLYAYKDNENGTVIVDMYTDTAADDYSSTGQPWVKDDPVWLGFIYQGSVATPSDASKILFASKNGSASITSSNNYAYTEDASSYYSKYSHETGQLVLYGTNANTFITGTYRMLYAYYPPSNPIMDTSEGNLSSDKMLEGAIGFSNGRRVEGTIKSQGAQTIDPSTTENYIEPGVYLSGRQTIAAIQTETKTVTQNGTVTPSAGKYLTSVTVTVPTGPNIKAGDAVKGYQQTNVTISSSGTSARTNYSANITVSNGTVSLSSPTNLTVSSTSSLDVVKGKYAQVGTTTGTSTNPIYYIPSDATFTQSGSSYNKSFTVSKANRMFVYGGE